MNKDLILREYLAIERTRLANETTFLAYVRTGLYFIVAGSTLGQLMETYFWQIAGTPLVLIGVVIIFLGAWRYRKVKKAIEQSKRNVGNSTEEFIKYARGNYSE
jgi:putative membrane protein